MVGIGDHPVDPRCGFDKLPPPWVYLDFFGNTSEHKLDINLRYLRTGWYVMIIISYNPHTRWYDPTNQLLGMNIQALNVMSCICILAITGWWFRICMFGHFLYDEQQSHVFQLVGITWSLRKSVPRTYRQWSSPLSLWFLQVCAG